MESAKLREMKMPDILRILGARTFAGKENVQNDRQP